MAANRCANITHGTHMRAIAPPFVVTPAMAAAVAFVLASMLPGAGSDPRGETRGLLLLLLLLLAHCCLAPPQASACWKTVDHTCCEQSAAINALDWLCASAAAPLHAKELPSPIRLTECQRNGGAVPGCAP